MSRNAFGYDPRLPQDIRDMFMWLCQDVASLHNKWTFYLGLFSSEENVALLSDLAPASFHMIEETLRNEIVLGICRLRDPPQSGSKDKANLSLEALVERCDHIDGVRQLLQEFKDASKPVRQHRDKRIAHSDLNTRIKRRDSPLPGIGRNQIDRILQLAAAILNTIYQQYVNGELYFTPVQTGGAPDLIYWLKVARDCKSGCT